ncbi:MAG: response regulator [candidate division Zixibacteria bacterium]|nr:response regulator [Candidatus Tariuqbacter arcticus]
MKDIGQFKPILVIDDEPVIRQMVGLILEEEGYEMVPAEDGVKGLELFKEVKPQIVITDIRMPGLDGTEVLARIKKMNPETEVIVITGHGEINLAIKALQMDASDFIQKPFGFEALSVAVWRAHEKIKVRETLAQTQVQLMHAEKLASLGQLAAGVAHEVNNPIGFVSSNLGTLKKYVEKINRVFELSDSILKGADSSVYKEYQRIKREHKADFILSDIVSIVDESTEGVERVRLIVQDLKEFSHIDIKKLTLYNINDGVNSTLNIISSEIKNRCKVEKYLGDIPSILCYPQQINQVLMNLLLNSAQAIANEGVITIHTYSEDEGIGLKISDSGVGIPQEIIDKIFDPFFTTKDIGEGSGLGLHIVYNIVNTHGGRIDVKSKAGEGTTFTLFFPKKPPNVEDS